MGDLKKLIFGPLFLISLSFLILSLKDNLTSYEVIFSLSITTLKELVILSGLISLTSLLFVLFISFSSSWKFILPIAIVASILPIILIKDASGFVLCIGILISLVLTFLTLENKLKTYLSFEPANLFGPSIRHMAALLILVFSFTYFLSINKIIQTKGFEIPDSLIDSAIKFAGQPQTSEEQSTTPQPSISPEQLDLLKKNPDLLRQSGLDPKILDTFNQSQKSSKAPTNLIQDTIKEAVKTQLDNIIKPYLGAVPAILAVLLFFLLQSLTSLINLLIYPLLWGIFALFEKTKFISFTTETRSVKKMVV